MPTPTLESQVGQVLLLTPTWRPKLGVVTQAQPTTGQAAVVPPQRGVGSPGPCDPGYPISCAWASPGPCLASQCAPGAS